MQEPVCFFGLCAEAPIWIGVLLWLLYILAFLFTRAFLVAGMLRKYTRAEIEATRYRIELEQERPETINPSEQVVLTKIQALLKEAEQTVSWTWEDQVKAVLAWNGGAELGAWRRIHCAERLAVEAMSASHLQARLLRAKGDLWELPPERRKVWETCLNRVNCEEQTDVEKYRAILSGFLADLYEARDERFTRVLKMQNLLSFIVIVGLLVGMVLVVAGYGPLLLAGATGGLLSRLSRIYRGSPQTPDYGLSWAQVFPASLYGALSAWAGLHLIAVLQAQGILSLQALGTLSEHLVPPVLFTKATVPLLAIGALFGLSERLLDRMVEKTEALWEGKPEEKPCSEPPKSPGEGRKPCSGPPKSSDKPNEEIPRAIPSLRPESDG